MESVSESRRRAWGLAWIGLAGALGLHVLDEELTGFLPAWNTMVLGLRDRLGWVPFPTFRHDVWLAGLVVLVALLLVLSIGIFRGVRFLRPISLILSVIMVFNGVAHLIASFWISAWAPGARSSAVLIVAAVALWITAHRAR